MRIKVETGCWNDRRYGRPWIAVCDFADGVKGKFKFGEFVGDDREGLLLLDAEVGDIVAQGQKDFRKPRNSAPEWYEVQADGELQKLAGKAEAFTVWGAKADVISEDKFKGFTNDEILDEAKARGLI